MKVWKIVNEEKPSKSGVYRVKTNGKLVTLKYAYYNLRENTWCDDDGWWLPMDVTSYVTHWAELNN